MALPPLLLFVTGPTAQGLDLPVRAAAKGQASAEGALEPQLGLPIPHQGQGPQGARLIAVSMGLHAL